MRRWSVSAYVSIVLAALLQLPSARADDTWTLLTSDFQTQAVTLRGVDDRTVTVAPAGSDQPRTIPLDQFLQLDRSSSSSSSSKTPASPFVLCLSSGDHLNGSPTGIKDEQLQWTAPALGPLALPLTQVRALLRPGRPFSPPSTPASEDTVYLSNGDVIRGVVSDIAPAQLTVQTAGQTQPIGLDTVASVVFAAVPAAQSSTPDSPGFRLRLSDGSSLVVSSATLSNGILSVLLGDKSPRQIDLSAITGIEQVNGPVSWLSSRTPQENLQKPYDSDTPWPARMDQSVTGKPIRFADRTFNHGIGVHAWSRLVYPLDGRYQAFRTQYAIDTSDTDGRFANVTIRIKLDDRIVHEQKDFKASVLSPPVLIPLAGAQTLTLEVDYGPLGDRQARLNWIEPMLLRHLPPTTSPSH